MNRRIKRLASVASTLVLFNVASASAGKTATVPNAEPQSGAENTAADRSVEGIETIDDRLVAKEFSVYFDVDEKAIELEHTNWFQHYAETLKASRIGKAVLTAFLEAKELNSFSLALADARLNAVADRLKMLGVPQRQIQTRLHYDSLGTQPCSTATCLASYRRVAISVVLPDKAKATKKSPAR